MRLGGLSRVAVRVQKNRSGFEFGSSPSREWFVQGTASRTLLRTPNTVGARILRKKTLRCKNTLPAVFRD